MRKGSMFLQLELTLMFVVFALLVGYSSYVVTTVSNTKMLLEQFLDTDQNLIKGISREYGNDWMLGLSSISRKNDNTRDLLKAFIPPEFKESITIKFYYRKAANDFWYLLRDSSKPRQDPEKVDDETSGELETILECNMLDVEHSFFDLNSSRIIFINVTRPGDTHKYVVQININRENLAHFILKNKDEWGIYTIVTFLISLLLGFIFAKSISVPIRRLSDGAIALSQGDLSIRFKMKRKDNIGELSCALNEMAINIESRINIIKTMNKIDKAVSSSISRKQLLEYVAGYISELFEGSIVLIFEKGAKSYRILAVSPQSHQLEKNEIFFTDMSEKYFRNDRSIYYFNEESLNNIHNILGNSRSQKKGVSIPLIQSNRLAGILVVLMEQIDEKTVSSLKSLADQVSVALLSMKEVEDRKGMYNAMLLALTRSVDTKSRWTAGHSERVTTHAVALADKLGFDNETREKIRIASLLHDIGKLGVSEAILDKPGKLTDEEFKIIRNHSAMGEKIIKDIPHFKMVRSVVRHHHERWDGTGYPDGLAKDSISLAARIVAIADVWDAVTADRPYRKGFSPEKALKIMESERGKLFDPALLDIFLKNIKECI